MKTNIVVAFGGESVEHEISILSAMQVMAALDKEKYEIIPLYIAKDGRMYSDEMLMDLNLYQDLDEIQATFSEVSLIRREDRNYVIPSHHHFFRKEIEFDMVFPVLHGTYGEDGSFQGYCKTLRIPFIGSDVCGAAIGQDKVIMKQLLQEEGIPITPWFHVSLYQKLDEAFFAKAKRLGYPLIIKPANLGSSVGIQIARDDTQLHKALIEAFQYDIQVVVEKLLTHVKEINCSVLGDEEHVRCSELEEVRKMDDILSYQDKYIQDGGSKGMASASRILPALMDDETRDEIQRYAALTFEILKARGVARIDFLIDEDTQDIYVNEINTIPGSLSYYLWEASDLPFSSLCDELIELSRKNARRNRKQIHSYQSNILKEANGLKLNK
ncbi:MULTISPECIES: D-alanine--D-alanine ligase family protein [Bacillota]|jgi:D-alanine-D-alanine ligase|uniref:D-alanine--D-alanine ligase n=2 Tax=Amedibacillus TaxID=2749846 RepID=A0A7G9GJA5_9FIRM|nr:MULTISPECIES: D-alanine--D-alanine ligase family protein [Bacillota]QNM10887.1 D-alanine--D-alanine ligase [[Eubacterium] hominis]MCH4285321.1 D-alanine--D-alanine ligase [Amedibacillus hominis]RGB58381.1 D-alanine--D-alanine ligase [Absiella sp. AM22-9]RGB63268.1 D-alanine--D-alanine ligase [Absiella sp. AM10-20]RGB67098.1 D-alanine--D-alanine ligase [Absiella sp. AM09-45]